MIVDGKELAARLLQKLSTHIAKLKEKNITPHLAVILIGNDAASESYVRQKEKKAYEIGAEVSIIRLSQNTQNDELMKVIHHLDFDKKIHGIIVQRPVPAAIKQDELDNAIGIQKDVDGLHPGALFVMPLAKAVIKILEEIHGLVSSESSASFIEWLKSKHIVVIGKGKTGGGPTIELLQKMGCRVDVIDSKTQNPHLVLSRGDIVISAIGKQGAADAYMLKQGAIVIQVGMHRGVDGKLHGDFDESIVEQKASYYTSVPGGIGPVNVACLLENLVKAAQNAT